MSIECISKGCRLEKEGRLRLIHRILESGYAMAYYAEESNLYGFVHEGCLYDKKEPPLFELSISEAAVVLSVYGDLHDLEIIKNTVVDVFNSSGITLSFPEESERDI